MLLSKEYVVDERSIAITDERSRDAARGLSTFLLVAPFGSSRDEWRTRRERRREQRSLCVLSLATTTSDSRKKTVRPVLSIRSRL